MAGFDPDISVLYCAQCLAAGADPSRLRVSQPGFRVRLAMMPCSSKVEISHVMRILAHGADGVLLVGCPEEACRFQVGSRMAAKRIERARELLAQVGWSGERVAMERGAGLTAEDLLARARELAVAVGGLGPSPMKGAGVT
jgi:F420-non-reducing hydrogenase iron-sulfur subunit